MNINRLQSGGLITNYYCSSKCKHCLYNCGPMITKNYISVEQTEKCLRKIKNLGCHSIHIGGGEPLLNIEKLLDVLKVANRIGVSVEYVETNSSWFKSKKQTESILLELIKHGLSCLLISISPFHNEYIPFYKVKGLIDACNSSGMDVFPWVERFASDIENFDDTKIHSLKEYETFFGAGYTEDLQYRYGLTLGGRALETYTKYQQKYETEYILNENKEPCCRLTDITHFHVDLYGNYIPGKCTGFGISVEDLGNDLSKDTYPILTNMLEEGINGLYKFAVKEHSFKPSDKGYTSKCHLCTEIRKFLVNEKYIDSKELNPKEFYSIGS